MKVKEFGSEYDWQANAAFMSGADTGLVGADWQLYRSGRDALKAFARVAGKKKVLLPALCCESMALPFSQNGYQVDYYRLQDDLMADEQDVWAKLERDSVLLYMRYFGMPSFNEDFLSRCRSRVEGLLLIEDRTHDVFSPRAESGFEPDAVMASLRKWTALPDGGMLITKLGKARSYNDSRFAHIRRKAMEKKSEYLESGSTALKSEYMHEFAQAAELLDEQAKPIKMGREEEKHLRHIDFEKLMARRVDNACYLAELLRPLEKAGKLRLVNPRPESSTLYLPVFLEGRNALHRRLIENAVYAAVIWPLTKEAAAVCPVTRWVNAHMLAIPCDHRCGREDMEFIAKIISDYFEEEE